MLTQKCPLCLEVKPIVRSHLIPQAVYDYCRAPGGNPIFITSKLVLETSRQAQHPLLCKECEEILNKGGESWLMPLLAQHEGPFPFYDLVTKKPPAERSDVAVGYAAVDNPDIDVDKLVHFGMGVFWKAAIHSWRESETEPLIQLGPYLEPVRMFLKGETTFPERMIFNIGVVPPPVKNISFTYPYRGQNVEWHNYVFYVSGIEFTLGVGNKVNAEVRQSCFASNPIHMIIVTDEFSKGMVANFRDMWKGAHKARNVEKYLAKGFKGPNPLRAKVKPR